jgi:hypothetical protein
MIDDRLDARDAERALAVQRRLDELGEGDADAVGRLSADLSNLYASATRYRQLLEAFLEAPPGDQDRLGDILDELREEMGHLRHPQRESVERMDRLSGDLAL